MKIIERLKGGAALFMALLLMLVTLAGCQITELPADDGQQTDDDRTGSGLGLSEISFDSGMKKFNSTKELLEFLKDSGSQNLYGNSYRSFGGMAMEEMAMDMDGAMVKTSAVPMPAGMAMPDSGEAGATDYSTTNIQVQGVDEADFVKNDGRYIYMLNQDKIVIVEAYPAEKAKIVFEDEISGRPRELFINGDRMAVFVEDDEEAFTIQPYDFVPTTRYTQQTHILVYDISDRKNPEIIKDYTMTGSYFQSRMIGSDVYFVVKDNVYYYNNFIDMPLIKESGRIVATPDIYYFDNWEDNYVFHTVGSFRIDDSSDDMEAESFLMGYSNTMYVSEDNIYITYQKNIPWRYQEEDRKDKFFRVVVPLLPSDIRQEIKQIQDSQYEDYEEWMKISEVMNKMYDRMKGSDAEDLADEIYDALSEYEAKLEADRRKTVIHKLAIDKGDIDYKASGEVPGYLLNQFSMDEHDANLRVATNMQFWSRSGSGSWNNVYVLDEELDTIGSLEKIAPDESIYSTRFIGDRLYMVTFERIDPLFVISLSDPRQPKILGELKIPGYSDYLHPYDEDHIIGIGKETAENQWGGVTTKGVKLALFDVSDVSSPKLLDKYEIGGSGSDSEALQDHKAFLFDKKKNLLVIPVREVKESRVYDREMGYYRDRVWQGAYVFSLTPKDGFEVKGRISHMEGLEKYDYYYYSGNAVRRSLYMDDVLYTISGKKILANDLSSEDLEEISEVRLPYAVEQRWWW